VLFVLSGFQDNNYSHGMASNFILTFAFYFLELYLLKPIQSSKQAAAAQASRPKGAGHD
jgi:hypothetical protein